MGECKRSCVTDSQTAKSRKRGGPSEIVRQRMARGADLVVAGTSMQAASRQLGLGEKLLSHYRWRHRAVWQEEVDRASKTCIGQVTINLSKAVPKRIKRAIAVMVAGATMKKAAGVVGMNPTKLYDFRRRHRDLWDTMHGMAKEQFAILGTEINVPEEIKTGISKATALLAGGRSRAQIGAALGVEEGTLKWWEERFPEFWKVEFDRAMAIAVIVVRARAGSGAVQVDAEGYIRQASRSKRWCEENGEPLFPQSEEQTLCDFYQGYFKPVRLADASPATIRTYAGVIRRWVLLTGDPPLKAIDVATMVGFRDSLSDLPGRKPGTRLAAETVRKTLRHLQTVLDKAGPAERGNRDGADLIVRVPWVRPPRQDIGPPRIATQEQLDGIYRAADTMTRPEVPGVNAPDWWRALVVLAFNTGLRARSLFEMQMRDIDWANRRIVLPPRRLKSRRIHIVHLNDVALAHLQRIRGDREFVFEWPRCRYRTCAPASGTRTFYKEFDRLQDAAGIPEAERIGLHMIRKALSTTLWTDSPQAAQLAMGHASLGVTQKHYVLGGPIVAAALDRLPQPAAFSEGAKSA